MQRRVGHGHKDGPLWQRLEALARSERPRVVECASGYCGGEGGRGLTVIHSVNSAFVDEPAQLPLWGARNVGIAFFESDKLPRAAIRNAKAYDLVLVGSTWNLECLRRHGVRHAALIRQGVDTRLFAPAARRGGDAAALPLPKPPRPPEGQAPAHAVLGDKGLFVIFSGGKLELRKGQDLVVAAFKRFAERHADAVLATAWYTLWPATMRGINAAPQRHVLGVPRVGPSGYIHFEEWLQRNGVPPERGFHLQRATHRDIAAVLQRADVALFPNRAEGGTNLAAMEAMASGVPVIISNNTGHVDVVDPAHCFPLTKQRVLAQRGLEGWSDSRVDEIVFALETVYLDRAGAEKKGRAAAAFIRSGFTWQRAIGTVASALSAYNNNYDEGDAGMTAGAMQRFADDVQQGAAAFARQPVQPQRAADLNKGGEAVVELASTDFERCVHGADGAGKDVLVEFYVPWCGDCDKLKPQYEQLAQDLKHVKSVVIARVDATANRVAGSDMADITGFPTVKLYPAFDKQNPVRPKVQATHASLLQLIKAHAHVRFTLDGMPYGRGLTPQQITADAGEGLSEDELDDL
eukprot:g974.t1